MTREEAASRARGVIEATAPAVGTPGQMGRSSQVAEYASAVDDEPTLRAILATYADRRIVLKDGLIVSDDINPNPSTL